MKTINSIIEILYQKKKNCKKRFIDHKRKVYWSKRLSGAGPKSVFFIGVPEHHNIGDSAIFLAELAFVNRCGVSSKRIKCVTEHEYISDHRFIDRYIKRGWLILGHGGGNMGNRYYSEEAVRRKMISGLPDNQIIVFPQTIDYYGDNKIEEETKSKEFYNGKTGLTLIAREKISYEKMKELYPDTEILLTPDIVLSSSAESFGAVPSDKRSGALFCMRNDGEKAVDNAVWEQLKETVRSYGLTCKDTDMISDANITWENRSDCVRKKMQEFCDAEIVFTDRLHGMVFAALSGTPCIVFSNNNHKVKGTYDWISYLTYIRYVNYLDEAEKAIPELLKTKGNRFDNGRILPLFEQISKRIKPFAE